MKKMMNSSSVEDATKPNQTYTGTIKVEATAYKKEFFKEVTEREASTTKEAAKDVKEVRKVYKSGKK